MLQSGHSIADYQIVKPLAENQLYETYQVTGPSGDSAKLLLIAAGQLDDKKTRQAFIDQSKILLGQSFPGLCPLIVVVASDEDCYCLYPILPGVSLAEQLPAGFPVRRSLEILRDLAQRLSLPHTAGLWHGAISPSTILLDADAVSLDEFALASLLRLDFNSGIDPCYSSPELVRGEPLSTASDLYSLGIVLYRLLTGAVPFNQADPFATAMQHVQDEAAPLQESLSLLQPLIDGLLCATASERWSAEQLAAEIDLYLLLPEIDSLSTIEEDLSEESAVLLVEPEEPSSIEKLMASSTMSARIEERLKDRAEILQDSSDLTADAKRASTARMSAIGQKSYRKTQAMNQSKYQQKSGPGRFLLLVALGVAIGAVLYLLLFGPQSTPQQGAAVFPEPLLAGLEVGSQQLEEGDLAAAEKTFQGLADSYALHPQPYNNLAAIYARQGDLERSRKLLERAMATDDSYVTVYRNLGTVYSEMARDSYGRALQLEKGQQAVTLQVFSRDELLSVSTVATAALDKGVEQPPLVAVVENVAVAPATAMNVEPVIKGPVAEAVTAAKPAVVETPIVAAVEPVTEVTMSPEPESAEVFLLRWAAAWSAQDVDSYLSFYAAEFTSADGEKLSDWAKRRRGRLTRPKSIEVTLSDFSMVRQAGDKIQIEVTQGYKSDRYADQTRKLFDLTHDGSDWQIVQERSLGRVR